MKRFVRRKIALLLFFISAIFVLLLSFVANLTQERTEAMLLEATQKRLVSASLSGSQAVTVEELNKYMVEEDTAVPEYEELRARLMELADKHDLKYLYYWRDNGDGRGQYIVDNDKDPTTQVTPDDYFKLDDDARTALSGKIVARNLGTYEDGWDNHLSAYTPMFDKDGNVTCVAGVDIPDDIFLTLRRNAALLLAMQITALGASLVSGGLALQMYRRKARQSESANKAKSEFLSNMSHEMRTPLNAIVGMTAIARKAAGDDNDQREYCLGRIESASSHLLHIVDDILEMSAIETAKLELTPALFSLEAMLRKAAESYQFSLEEKKQEFTLRTDSEVPPLLVGDEKRLAKVVGHLLSNAVKFTPEGGSIRLGVRLEKEEGSLCVIQVTVADTGIGIDKGQQAHIFTSFQQADSGASRKFGGAGLGLALCKRIVELMGGRIWVESEAGKGTAVTFAVALRRGSAESVANSVAGPENFVLGEERDFSAFRLLLVDDVEVNREIVQVLLESTGLRIDCAENGVEALRLFSAAPDAYDFVFMDLQMPDMDGFEAARRIRAFDAPRAATIPIVALTANVSPEDVAKCFQSGMNGHVGKPVELAKLLGALNGHLPRERDGNRI